MKTNFLRAAQSLVPIPVFFVFCILLAEALRKFTIVGPVDPILGQPVFGTQYSAFVFYGLMLSILVGFGYSLYQIFKVQGWIRYVGLALAVIFLPLQYLMVLVTLISLFGK